MAKLFLPLRSALNRTAAIKANLYHEQADFLATFRIYNSSSFSVELLDDSSSSREERKSRNIPETTVVAKAAKNPARSSATSLTIQERVPSGDKRDEESRNAIRASRRVPPAINPRITRAILYVLSRAGRLPYLEFLRSRNGRHESAYRGRAIGSPSTMN